jgi:threonine dehydrogenase-like Zn-dependent dehydrogenase
VSHNRGRALMRAAVLRAGEVVVRDDVPEPVPELGQVLVAVRACGICGSDLHFVRHGPTLLRLAGEMSGLPPVGAPAVDLDRDVFMGHEFAAEVLEAGPGTVAPPPGTLVTSIPAMISASGVQDLVYSNDLPAGYGERMLLSAPLLLEVPNGLDARVAALTEPLAVGVHAVNRSGAAPGDGALVLGCGPVGLAVIAALRMVGVEPVVATDLSPARRALAATLGAHEVVDPAVEPAFEAWARVGGARPVVVFEAIGVPGILDAVLRDAPHRARVMVVGVCMEPDRVTPFYGSAKELTVQFSFAYEPDEFATTLRALAEGTLDVTPMITGEVDVDGVPAAFADLADPQRHCKVLVVPGGSP